MVSVAGSVLVATAVAVFVDLLYWFPPTLYSQFIYTFGHLLFFIINNIFSIVLRSGLLEFHYHSCVAFLELAKIIFNCTWRNTSLFVYFFCWTNAILPIVQNSLRWVLNLGLTIYKALQGQTFKTKLVNKRVFYYWSKKKSYLPTTKKKYFFATHCKLTLFV